MNDTGAVATRHRPDVDDHRRMGDAGILGEHDRAELIDRKLIDIAPIGPDHIASVNGLAHALFVACGVRAVVSIQNPLRLGRLNEPQQDVVAFRPGPDFSRPNVYGSGPLPRASVCPAVDRSGGWFAALRSPREAATLRTRRDWRGVWIVDSPRRVVNVHQPAGLGRIRND